MSLIIPYNPRVQAGGVITQHQIAIDTATGLEYLVSVNEAGAITSVCARVSNVVGVDQLDLDGLTAAVAAETAAIVALHAGGKSVTSTDVTSGDTAQTAESATPAAGHHAVVTSYVGEAVGADFKVELKDGSTVIRTLFGNDGEPVGETGIYIAITTATAVSVVVTKLSGTTTHITASLTTVTAAD